MNVEDVKASLVGLLSSNKFAYDLRSLLKDFEELLGCSMPLFGHQNAVEFLKSLPETLQLSGDNFNPEVYLIASEKSAHIVSLTDRQKISSKLSRKNLKRRTVFKNSDIVENWRESKLQSQKMQIKVSEENKKEQNQLQNKLHSGKVSNQNLTLKSDSDKMKVKINESFDVLKKTDCCEKELVDNNLNKLNLDLIENPESSFSYTNTEVNENIKNKLKDLIQEHCNGVWCCDLPKLFFQKFKYELNFKEFGYTSLINMLSDLPKIFRCIRPGQDDWILFDASAPPSQMEKILMELDSKEKLSKDVQETLKFILKSNEYFRNGNTDLDEMLSLVPESEQSDYVFPNDVMGPKDTMVDIDLNSHVLLGERIDIYSAEVWSPSLFYIHLQKFSIHFQRFMYDLQQFYDAHISEYKMPDFLFKPKQICAGLYTSDPHYPEEWYRMEIVDVVSEKMVVVNFVDFGTEAVIKKNKLRFLHRAFQFFPIQGIAASLAGITAFDDKKDWPVSTSAKLIHLIHFAKLQAEVVSIENRGKPSLNLIVYLSKNGPSLNKQLVDEKLAKIKGTILISRDKSYENFVETSNIASNLVNSPKSSMENSLHLEVYKKEELTKIDESINEKDGSCNECETKENKVVQEQDLTEKFLFDVDNEDMDDIYFSPEETVEQKSSNVKSISTQNSCNQIVNEDVRFKNKSNGSQLEKAHSIIDTHNNLPPGLEAYILNLNLSQNFLQQEEEYSMKKINLALQFLNSSPILKEIAMYNLKLVLSIVIEMSEAFLRKFNKDTTFSEICNSLFDSNMKNFNNSFFFSSLNSNILKTILGSDTTEMCLPSNYNAKMSMTVTNDIDRNDTTKFSSLDANISDTAEAIQAPSPSSNCELISDNFKNNLIVTSLQNIPDLGIMNSSKANLNSPSVIEVETSQSPSNDLHCRDQDSTGQKMGKNILYPELSKSLSDDEENSKSNAFEELQTTLSTSTCKENSSSASSSSSHINNGNIKSTPSTPTGSSNNIISINSETFVTKSVSVQKSTNISSLNSQNLKYVKAENICGKTIHLILKENIYICIEEIIEYFTLFSNKGEIVNLLLQSRSQYFDFSILTWVDNKDILSEFMSCSSIKVSKKKRKKQKINILPLSKVIFFLQSLGCNIHPYASQLEELQKKYNAE